MADQSQTQQHEDQTESSQPHFDARFFEQMSGGGQSGPSYEITTQVVQSYFEQIEAQTRQARRMADLWAQSLILQQTRSEIVRTVVPIVTQSVVAEIRRDPTLLKQFSSSK